MSQNPFLDQIEKNVISLLNAKKFKEAYKICEEAFLKFPNESELVKLEKLVEERIHESNAEFIKEKIETLEPEWEKENYTLILKELRKLLELDKNNEKVKRLYLKAEEKYKEKIAGLQQKFEKEESARLEQLLKENEQKLLEDLFNLEMKSPGNKKVKELTRKFRDRIIEKRISEMKDLFYSEKYEAIENFLGQLKKIDKDNPRIAEVEKIYKQRKLGSLVEEKKEFLYEGKKHLITLMKLHKYDKAIKVAEELLAANNQDTEVQKILQDAQKNFFKQTKNQTAELISQNIPALKEDYQKNKDKYTKL